MECNHEMLQLFLDRELEPEQAKELKKHLARCRECRQELSRLKLMWLELEQEEELDLPPELPFLRQQAIRRQDTVTNVRRRVLLLAVSKTGMGAGYDCNHSDSGNPNA